MNTIKEVKQKANEMISNAVNDRALELVRASDVRKLRDKIQAFENDPYNGNYSINECGLLNSSLEFNLPASLVEEDTDVIEATLAMLTDSYAHFNSISREWEVVQCLGEPVIYNQSPERNCYAIYSNELKLKVSKVLSEQHGFLLIEQAMRKCGVFENIVSTDYYGSPTLLEMPKNISTMTDEVLEKVINSYGSES